MFHLEILCVIKISKIKVNSVFMAYVFLDFPEFAVEFRLMKEEFLHFVWRTQSFAQLPLTTTDGKVVKVEYPGFLNRHAGPDFMDARVQIGDVLWCGPVELHVKASDWLLHGHSGDPRYDTVILHVVYEKDQLVPSDVPILELKNYIIDGQWNTVQQWKNVRDHVPCGGNFAEVRTVVRTNWMNRMAVERLEKRVSEWRGRSLELNGDLLQLFYEKFFRAFGFGLNGELFEQVASRFTFRNSLRILDEPELLKAVLLQMFGFESARSKAAVWKRAGALMEANQWISLPPQALNTGKIRPRRNNKIRVEQLAEELPRISHWWNLIFNKAEIAEWKSALYSKGKSNPLFAHLTVNVFAPLLFFLHERKMDESYAERALELLELIPLEDNRITRLWKIHDVVGTNALESQGLIHLYGMYCETRKCLSCALGAEKLKKNEHDEVLI